MYHTTINHKVCYFDINTLVKKGEGNEGVIYDMGNGKLIKIFKKNKEEKCEKVKAMLTYVIQNKITQVYRYCAWPMALVYNDQNEEVGYLMKHFKGENISSLNGQKKVNHIFPNFTYKDLFDVSIALIESIDALRSFIPNFVIGDFSGANVLVNANKQVCLIDMDSISFSSNKWYPCKVSTIGFRSYETIINLSQQKYTFSSKTDDFALASIVFILLSQYHPYSNNNGKSYDYCIKNNICPLFDVRYAQYRPILKFDYTEVLDGKLLHVFKRFFIDGCQNRNNRPSLSELKRALYENKMLLKPCKKIYHYYIGEQCPFCKNEKNTNKVKKIKPTHVQNTKVTYPSPPTNTVSPYRWVYRTLFIFFSIAFMIWITHNYSVVEGHGNMACLCLVLMILYGSVSTFLIDHIYEALLLYFGGYFCICLGYEFLYFFCTLIFGW